MPYHLRIPALVSMSFVLLAALLFSHLSFGAVLFEGYAKVILQGKHVGYIIQQYDFDQKKKHYVVRHFLHAEGSGLKIRESLVARSTAGFKPVSYQYTEQQGKNVKLIDIRFRKGKMLGKIQRGTKGNLSQEIISKKVPKGAFLASFLYYLMLTGKDGIKKGVKYDYSAIAEEDAAISKGSAYVSQEQAVSGIPTFKVLNQFKSGKYVSYITSKAETIMTRNPTQSVETLLVKSAEDATRGMPVNTNSLKAIFGKFPKGINNPVAKAAQGKSGRSSASETIKALPEVDTQLKPDKGSRKE